MKRLCGILVLTVFCISCNSFGHVRYRHVRKVPAHSQLFSLADQTGDGEISTEQVNTGLQIDSVMIATADTITVGVHFPDPGKDSALVSPTQVDTQVYRLKHAVHLRVLPQQRHDWSLAIAIMMILAGILLVVYGIFVLPYIGIFLLFRIALGILFGFAAMKLIVAGISIFRNRFRQPKDYKENG